MLLIVDTLLFIFSLTDPVLLIFFFFFFNDTATTEIYTLSLHDALPICISQNPTTEFGKAWSQFCQQVRQAKNTKRPSDRKSTRLNSSHLVISYAVFCLKKKKNRPADVGFAIVDHYIHVASFLYDE